MEPTEGYVKILDFKLFYRSYGKPTKGTLLCLHGGPGATHDYLMALEDLAQFGYRVVLIDQLGCGKSERPPRHGPLHDRPQRRGGRRRSRGAPPREGPPDGIELRRRARNRDRVEVSAEPAKPDRDGWPRERSPDRP